MSGSPLFELKPKDLSRKKAGQRRSQLTVATILESARQILLEQGEEAVTTTAVAERAGYSVGTVYQYYPHRDAIFVALAEQERALIAMEMRQCIAALDLSPRTETTRLFVRALIASYGRARGARRQCVLMTALQLSATSKLLREDFAAWLAAFWDRVVANGSTRSHEVNAFVLTHAMFGVLQGAAAFDYEGLGEPDFEEALMRLIAAMRPGV